MRRWLKNALWRLAECLLTGAAAETHAAGRFRLTEARSILVIRPDRLGDVILSTPVYESLKRSCPSARLTVLAHARQTGVLRGNPFIDEIIVYDPRAPWRVLKPLRGGGFDLAIALNHMFSSTAAFLALLSRAPWRAGYDNPRAAAAFNLRIPKTGAPLHEVQHNLNALRFLNASVIVDEPQVFPGAAAEQRIEIFLAQSAPRPELPLVLIKPGTRVAKWGWQPGKFARVGAALLRERLANVYFLVGPGEESLVAGLAQGLAERPAAVPPLTVAELACLLRRADLLFCNHTGIMHLAAAVKTPVAAIFKHGDPRRWAPYKTPSLILNERAGEDLPPETVLAELRQFLSTIISAKEPRA